jgi:hypothetical protein
MRARENIQAVFYTLVFITITTTSLAYITNFYSIEIDETTYVSHFIDARARSYIHPSIVLPVPREGKRIYDLTYVK